MNLAVFQRRDPGGVLWQPRLEYWYEVNRARGTVPEQLKGATLIDVYDYCQASMRYFTKPLRQRYRNVRVEERWESEKRLRTTWHSAVGALTEVTHFDEWGLSGYHTEYKLKGPHDFVALEYSLADEEWEWDQALYEQDLQRVGNRGCPQFYFRRSPVQALFIEHMGFERAIYMLYDHPELVQRYVEVASQADNTMYDVLCHAPVQILNLGENIDAAMDPPPIWREHLVPYYRRRVAQLQAAGKFVHIHVDGAMKPLLPHLRDCPWDGIEAATPLPQGDISLQQIKEALGDSVLLDGIPAVYFLPSFSEDTLMECVRELVDLFYPRLVLGISDELPPDGLIDRVRLVGQLVQALV